MSRNSFGSGGMPLMSVTEVISHRPGLTLSLSACAASGSVSAKARATGSIGDFMIVLPRTWRAGGSHGHAAPDRCVRVSSLTAIPTALECNFQGAAAVASRKLSNYRAKRDFRKTAEPSGALPVRATRRLRFVIQKHAATPAALRPATRARRRVQVVGGHARPVARSAGQAPGRGGRGSSARLRRFRRHDPEGAVRRRHACSCGIAVTGEPLG